MLIYVPSRTVSGLSHLIVKICGHFTSFGGLGAMYDVHYLYKSPNPSDLKLYVYPQVSS